MEEINTPETADGTKTKVKIAGVWSEKKSSRTKRPRQEPTAIERYSHAKNENEKPGVKAGKNNM